MKKIISIFLLLAIVFLLFPEIDLYFSSLFVDENRDFYLKDNFYIKLIYDGVILISTIFTASIFILLILSFVLKKKLLLPKRALFYLLLVVVIGPGIVVNAIFKDSWGRARPHQTINFNGDKSFTPPFIKVKQCKKNCSFVCGHAASGFFLFAFIPLFRNFAKRVALLAIFLGGGIGLVRVIQGGHFLSDVIFSGFFIYFTYKIVYYLIYKEQK